MAEQGLTAAPPAAGAGLGAQPTMTMGQRALTVGAMRNRGMSQDEIVNALSQYGIPDPIVSTPDAPPPTADEASVGILGELAYGARNTAEDWISGLGNYLGDEYGLTDVADAATGVGEWVGPTAEQEDRQRMQQEARQRAAEAGEMGEAERFMRDAGDSIVQSFPGMAPTMGGAAAGAAAGAAIGSILPGAGTAIGAALGGMVGGFFGGAPMHYQQSRDVAEQNGLDPSDPDVQDKIAKATFAKAALDSVVPAKILRMARPGVAEKIIQQSALKRAGKELLTEGSTEALTEATQTMTDAVAFDEELMSKLTAEDKRELLPYFIDRYGREVALSIVAGGALGGGLGAAAGGRQQALTNAALKQSVNDLAKAGEEAGVQGDELVAATGDAERAGLVVEAAKAISAAEKSRTAAQNAYDQADPEMRDQPGGIGEVLAAANSRADAARDKYLPQFGGKTTAEITTEKQAVEQERAQAAAKRASELGIAPTVEGIAPTDVEAAIAPYEQARTERETAEERLRTAGTPKVRRKYEKRLREARQREADAEVEARRVLRGENPLNTRRKIRHEQAVQDQRLSMFPDEDVDPQATLDAANEVIDRRGSSKARQKNLESIDKNIAKLERHRQTLDDPAEIAKVNAQIADEQAKKASTDPALEAANRAKREALKRLGLSPEEEATMRAEAAAAAAEEAQAEAEQEAASDQGETTPEVETTEGQGQTAPETAQSEGASTEAPSQPTGLTEAGVELPAAPDRYFETTEDTTTVPVAQLRPLRARPTGVTNAGKFMRKAYDGEMAPRKPISVRAESDGTYTVLDGNATYANMAQAGWADAPVRVVTDEQFAREIADKFGKKTGTKARAAGGVIRAEGPESQRAAVMAYAEKSGVKATFKATAEDGAEPAFEPKGEPPAADDPRREGWDSTGPGGLGRWKDHLDAVGPDATMADVEAWMAQNAGHVEFAAAFDGDGNLLGLGTYNHPNGVIMPKAMGRAKDVTMLHSHPLATPFSSNDVVGMQMATNSVASRVVQPDGSVIEMRPTQALRDMNRDQLMDYLDGFYEIVAEMTPINETKLLQDRVRQEALLRALDADGLIEYSLPIDNLTSVEEDLINGIVDRHLAGPDQDGGLRADERAGAAPSVEEGPAGGTGAEAAAEAPQAEGYRSPPGLSADQRVDPAAFDKLKNDWKAASIATFPDVDSMLSAGKRNDDRLAALGSKIQRATGNLFKKGPLKERVSIERKLADKGIPAGALGDVVRGGFIVPSAADADRVVEALAAEAGDGIEVAAEDWRVTPAGYADRSLVLRFPDGQLAEIQLWEPHMFLAKEGRDPRTMEKVALGHESGHRFYEIERDKSRPAAERAAANATMRDLYGAAATLASPDIQALVFGKDPSLAAAEGNAFLQSLSVIDDVDGRSSSEGLPTNQSPATNENTSSPTDTTASPSDEKNSMGASPVSGEATNPTAGTQAPVMAAAVDLRSGNDSLAKYGIEPGQTHKTRDIAAALEARQRELHGTIAKGDFSPEAMDKIADWMAEEVMFEGNVDKADAASAMGWYSEKFQRALDTFANLYPELARDATDMQGTAFTSPKHARDFLTALIAITSDGEKVYTNFKRAAQLYGEARISGVLPTNTKATRGVSMRINADMINRLQAEHGAGMREYLLEQVSVSDLNKELRAKGERPVTKYQAHMLMPRAAIAFGAKLGAFYANLSGADGYLTMDRWWSRTFNRYRGNLLDAPSAPGKARVKEMLGNPDMTDDQMLVAIQPEVEAYKATGYKVGTPLQRAANTVWKAATENLNDVPFGAKDRTFMIDTVQLAQKKLQDQGLDISVADIQAVLWYYEKRLYAEMGARATPDVSYEEVANRVIAETNSDGGATGVGPVVAAGVDGPDGAAFPVADAGSPRIGDDTVAVGNVVDQGGAGQGRDTGAVPSDRQPVGGPAGDAGRPRLVDAKAYDEAMDRAGAAVGPVAAQVSRVPADSTAQRYLMDGGNTGYALDGDNIIGVFSHPDAPKGAAQRVLADAVARGGRRLDGFDTYLPKLYARAGFRAVARLAFDPQYAPSVEGGALADWDAEAMEAMRPGWGSPDVVFMAYDPANADPDTDNVITDYDDGIAAQESALAPATGTAPLVAGEPAPLYVARDVIDDGGLRKHFEDAGLTGMLEPDDMHLTVTYSRDPVDIADAPARSGGRTVTPLGKPKMLGNALAQPLSKTGVEADHRRYRKAGASHDYGDSYEPHITLKYDPTPEEIAIAQAAPPFRGKIKLGGEVQKRLNPGNRPEPKDVGPIGASGIDILNRSRQLVETPKYMATVPKTEALISQVRDAARTPAASLTSALAKVEQNFFNRLSPIRRLEIGLKGALATGAESAYKNAEMAVNDSGRNEALLYYGAAKLGKHGEFQIKEGTKGLRQIFDMAVEGASNPGQAMTDWMSYMIARRAKELAAKGIKTPLTSADIDKALAKGTPAFDAAADAWKAHNDANIDYLVDTGRITKAQADGMKVDEFYVPFYRSDQRADGTSPDLDLSQHLAQGGGGSGGHILARDPGIKKMVGGDKLAIDNLLQNMVRNSQAMVAAGARNHAANMTFDLMAEAGMAKVVKGQKISRKTGQLVGTPKPQNSVAMWKDGKPKWVVVTDESAIPVVTAMAAMAPVQLNAMIQLATDIAAIFRQSITLSPAFMIRNAIRGAVSTGLLTSGANLTAQNNTFTGMRDALRKGDATKSFTHITGMGDYRFGGSDVGFGKNDMLIDYGLEPKTAGYMIRKAIDKAEALGTATELADRIAAFETLKQNGVREDEAAYQALSIMNYGRRGAANYVRSLLPMVPFLNARLQGLSRLAEGAVGRRGELARKRAMIQLAMNGVILTGLSTALWALNNNDEEKREKYKAEPQYRRLNYHILYAGENTIYIPKAFELGHVFSSLPELMLDAVANDMGDEFSPGVTAILGQTLGFNAIPAAAMPIIEASANYSFFRDAPIEGARQEGLLPRDRTEGSSAFSQFVGRQLGVSDLTGLSPIMLEHYAQGYGGVFYSMLSSLVGAVGPDLGIVPPPVQGAYGTVPVISPAVEKSLGSIMKRTDLNTGKYLGEFYETLDHITQIYGSAKAAATNGDVDYAKDLLAKVPGLPVARKLVNKASSEMGDLNSAIRNIRADPKLSSSQKAAKLAPLVAQRNELSRKVVEAIDKIEAAQGLEFSQAG